MIVNLFVVIQLLRHSVALYKQIMVKALLKYLLYCRVLTFQCLAMSLNSGWCQVKKVGDLHKLCIGKFTGWCCPRNNPALMQGQQDTEWKDLAWLRASLDQKRVMLERELLLSCILNVRKISYSTWDSIDRNSSSPNKFKQKAGYSTCHSRVNNLMTLSAI